MGLEIAIAALELSKNDEVIVTPRGYYSSASCIIKNNLKPVFVDIDIKTQNILVNDLLKKITKKTKCIICVHLGGIPCEMNKIIKIANKFNIKVIEDCSTGHGAMIDNKSLVLLGILVFGVFVMIKLLVLWVKGA